MKKFAAIAAAAVMMMMSTMTVQAGWASNAIGWWYEEANGSYYTMIQGSLTSVLLPCQVFDTIVTRLLDCPAQCT